MIVSFTAEDLEVGMVTGHTRSHIVGLEVSPRKIVRRGKEYAGIRVMLMRPGGSVVSHIDLLPWDPLAILLDGDGEPVKAYPCAVCGYAATCGDPPGSGCHS